MVRKGLCALLVVVGLSIVTFALVADMVGPGAGGDYVFGWDQKLGVVVGLAIAWFAGLHALGWRPGARSTERVRDAADVGSTASATG